MPVLAEHLIRDGVGYVALPMQMTAASVQQFCMKLMLFSEKDEVERICLRVFSEGGDFSSLLLICFLLEKIGKPIETVIYGKGALSVAVPVALLGAKGKRWMHPDARLGMHEVRFIVDPHPMTVNKLEKYMEPFRTQARNYCGFLAEGSLRSEEEWFDLLYAKSDVFLSSGDALELGMVDVLGIPEGFPW